MQNRTFKLFVSSTFSDFNEERKLLQTIVFPEIKKYCRDNGLNFQPIDLRWGVTEEASNDQKTLNLCLEEVQNSKYHPYPNFLIMVGDRYGWVPLPYAIEQNEYEILLQNIDDLSDKKLLNIWYKLDENQIPASYILNERKKADNSHDGIDYTNKDNWRKIENQLKTILQTSVQKSNLDDIQKRKYFTSATEAEVIEGIFKYLYKTEFQKKLLHKNGELEKIDYENVFAYIRNIESVDNENFKDKFLDKNSSKVNYFKNEIRKSIHSSNILELDVNLINVSENGKNGSLVCVYDEIKNQENSIFAKKMIEYLKSSIDKFLSQIKDITEDEIEKYEQERFKDLKVKDFLPNSRKEALKRIEDYISSEENQTLVIYGKSGLGKSSLIAKAIDDAEIKFLDTKIIYKFIGSTINLTITSEILISILKELGIIEEVRKIQNPQTLQEENEKIDEFYYRVQGHLTSIKENTIIFIDGVDQLINEDQFIWLPKELQSNLKIVISALNDNNYKKDSKYFENIKNKTKNVYELQAFNSIHAKALVVNLLEKYNRTISEEQMNYILDIFKNINSPLYLVVAVQELRNWRSTKKNQVLANTQQDLIKEFIDNLTILYHHDKELVKRVFSYILLSDGLSESELLELLSSDKDFLNKIAPETYHINLAKELPIVIWSRLHTQIKKFLKLENIDNQNVMKFFYREFRNKINFSKDDFEHLINMLEKIVIKYKYLSFSKNRWIKILIQTIEKYYVEYEANYDGDIIDFEDTFKHSIKIEEWNKTILNCILKENKRLYEVDSENMLKNYLECSKFLSKYFHFISEYEESHNLDLDINQILKKLYKHDNLWAKDYIENLKDISNYYYHRDETNQLLDIQKEILLAIKDLCLTNENWYDDYFCKLDSLAYYLEELNKFSESIELRLEAFFIMKNLIKKDPILWIEKYSSSLISVHKSIKDNLEINEAIKVLIEAFKILEDMYQKNNVKYIEKYIKISINLANSFIYIKKFDEAIDLKKKVMKIFKELYKDNPNEYQLKYLESLSSLSDTLENIGKYYEIVDFQEKIIKIFEDLYKQNPDKYISKYSASLYKQATIFRKIGNIDKAINFENKSLKIFEDLYKDNPSKYGSKYSESLNRQASILRKIGNIDEAINFENKAFKILKNLYNEDFFQWEDDYSSLLPLITYPPHIIYREEYIKEIKYGLQILKSLFEDNPYEWIDIYVKRLNEFVLVLNKLNMKDDALEFEIEVSRICQIYYKNETKI
ncbi:DUF4062 domain-containing protein [Arcobacter cryaerophilus gv. pseudocryaerophilus]|uniref:DUF4062 domain-containing protein n=2 Tax=Arcobacteraceae TaxID=2808963 RepID=A0AAU0P4R6_9BACT|nr:DUF4062 domain-containing protein [Arcobacter sp. AZ-2023]WPD03249.1 DUF4062 domain-containing protein [Arcobacter sp. DSM 115972]